MSNIKTTMNNTKTTIARIVAVFILLSPLFSNNAALMAGSKKKVVNMSNKTKKNLHVQKKPKTKRRKAKNKKKIQESKSQESQIKSVDDKSQNRNSAQSLSMNCLTVVCEFLNTKEMLEMQAVSKDFDSKIIPWAMNNLRMKQKVHCHIFVCKNWVLDTLNPLQEYIEESKNKRLKGKGSLENLLWINQGRKRKYQDKMFENLQKEIKNNPSFSDELELNDASKEMMVEMLDIISTKGEGIYRDFDKVNIGCLEDLIKKYKYLKFLRDFSQKGLIELQDKEAMVSFFISYGLTQKVAKLMAEDPLQSAILYGIPEFDN